MLRANVVPGRSRNTLFLLASSDVGLVGAFRASIRGRICRCAFFAPVTCGAAIISDQGPSVQRNGIFITHVSNWACQALALKLVWLPFSSRAFFLSCSSSNAEIPFSATGVDVLWPSIAARAVVTFEAGAL